MDWTDASWITPSDDGLLDSAAPMLRQKFHLTGQVVGAHVAVSGLGLYELRLNGSKVGDHQLAPPNTNYAVRCPYAVHDVTGLLTPGANAIGIWLGRGYGQTFSKYGFRWTGPRQAILKLIIDYADGSQQSVVTDNAWRWSTGAIRADDLYAGETFDARLEQQGWDTTTCDDQPFKDQPYNDHADDDQADEDHDWTPTEAAQPPQGRLVAEQEPAIRIVRTIRPVALHEPQPGVFIFDLGENIAGWARLRVAGQAGETVRLRTGEELHDDGMLDPTTNRDATSTDTYICSGHGSDDGFETYQPRFTYHGFRYLEVTGFPGHPTLDSITGCVVHTDLPSTGEFHSSSSLLNQIWANNRRAIVNNSMGTPTDTPVRDERTPPAMDVQAYADAALHDFAVHSYYAGYLDNLPPGTALPHDAHQSQQPDMAGGQVSLPWKLYRHYGNLSILERHYSAMRAFVDTNASRYPDHVWPEDLGFGDWCAPHEDPDANASEISLVNTALSYEQAQAVAKTAEALGDETAARHYQRLAASIRSAFSRAFLNPTGDGYGSGRQTTSILPLALRLVPDDLITVVGQRLVQTILEVDRCHLDTGIFGTRYLLDALDCVGRLDVAVTMLEQPTYPGFGFQIANGATTPWEQWSFSAPMQTHDHAMFAGINASFYRLLAGIEPARPGFREIRFRPRVPVGLTHVRAQLDTISGRVGTAWTVAESRTETESRFQLTVEVPAGATAEVHLPFGGDRHRVGPGRHHFG